MQHDTVNPVTLGANIAHARKHAGLTQATLAEAIGISRPTLIGIESGQRRPSEAQLVVIANLTGSRLRDLLSLDAPDESLTVRFRTLGSSAETQAAVDALESFGRRYKMLESLANDRITRREPPEFPLARITNISQGADVVAATERQRLGLGDGPLPDLRTVFEEDSGLRIFGLENLRRTRIPGIFAYSAEYGPLVGFNPAQDPRRIRWTLCHEYAHYLTERFEPEVTVEYSEGARRKDRREMFADAFAARFLMPTTGLSRRFNEMLNDAEGKLRVAHLFMLANFFAVSFQAITKRLEEIELVTRGSFEMLSERGLKVRQAEELLGLANCPKNVENLPVRYVLLVTRLYSRGTISEGDVASFFGTDRLSARAILQSVPESTGEGSGIDAGLDTQVEVAG